MQEKDFKLRRQFETSHLGHLWYFDYLVLNVCICICATSKHSPMSCLSLIGTLTTVISLCNVIDKIKAIEPLFCTQISSLSLVYYVWFVELVCKDACYFL